LCETHGFSPDDYKAVLYIAQSISDLVYQAEQDVASVSEVNPELYVAPVNKLNHLKRIYEFNQPVVTLSNVVDEVTMIQLRYIIDMVARSLPIQRVDMDAVEALRKDVQELIAHVTEAQIGEELQQKLLSSLEHARMALNTVDLGGTNGLEGALLHGLGTMVYLSHLDVARDVSTEEKATVKKTFDFIIKYGAIVTTAKTFVELAEKAYDLICK
jgi:hypothetical protein